MTKQGVPSTMPLVVAFLTFTLGLTSAGGVPGALARDNDGIQAPRATRPDSSLRADDPLQAPRSHDPQTPRDAVASSDTVGI
jgi:hypothetical protein